MCFESFYVVKDEKHNTTGPNEHIWYGLQAAECEDLVYSD